jgi:hypothetical protein
MSCPISTGTSDRSIEMFQAGSGNLKRGKFDLGRMSVAWTSKLDGTLARGSPA